MLFVCRKDGMKDLLVRDEFPSRFRREQPQCNLSPKCDEGERRATQQELLS
jgi:hypothetical protein